jgi:phosphoglycolate phosphatase
MKLYESHPISVIFDFDGTLVNSAEAIIKTWEYSCQKHGILIPDHKTIVNQMGVPLDLIAKLFVEGTEINHDELVVTYKKEFNNNQNLVRAYKGIDEMLVELYENGVSMYVVSARSSDSLNSIIKDLNLSRYFKKIIGAGDVNNCKPHPEAIEKLVAEFELDTNNVVMVGDASVDMQMGLNAGVTTLFVEWGAHTMEDIIALRISPDYLAQDPIGILEVIESLGE